MGYMPHYHAILCGAHTAQHYTLKHNILCSIYISLVLFYVDIHLMQAARKHRVQDCTASQVWVSHHMDRQPLMFRLTLFHIHACRRDKYFRVAASALVVVPLNAIFMFLCFLMCFPRATLCGTPPPYRDPIVRS